MKPHKKYFVLAGLLLFLFATTGIVYASSSTFFTQAQKFINQNCNKKILADPTALLCYLFDKSQEQDTKIAAINATLSPIPSQIASLNQQYQTLSASMSSIQAPVNWDITGTYTFQFYDTNGGSPDGEFVTITTVDLVTGQFSGTGHHSTDTLTVSGIVNGSQFTLHTQTTGGFIYDIKGSIAPDGTFWGVGKGHDGHGFIMTTLSGAATKKN